jgi:hypothetical protein
MRASGFISIAYHGTLNDPAGPEMPDSCHLEIDTISIRGIAIMQVAPSITTIYHL